VEVRAQLRPGRGALGAREEIADLGRRADADCVGQGDLERRIVRGLPEDLLDARGRDFALERAAERHANGHGRLDPRIVREPSDFAPALHQPIRRRAGIADRKAVRGRQHEIDFLGARRRRPLEAPAVQHQRDVADAVVLRQAGHDRVAVSHLRYFFRIDEARHLDAAETRRDRARDQLELVFGRDDFRFVLQPVARADFEECEAGHWLF
jgi:hypothetical protein